MHDVKYMHMRWMSLNYTVFCFHFLKQDWYENNNILLVKPLGSFLVRLVENESKEQDYVNWEKCVRPIISLSMV